MWDCERFLDPRLQSCMNYVNMSSVVACALMEFVDIAGLMWRGPLMERVLGRQFLSEHTRKLDLCIQVVDLRLEIVYK